MMYYGFDWTYILVMIGALLCIFASSHVTSTYNRYARTRSACGMSGAQVAQEILRRNGVSDVTVQHVAGNLTDHYNPATKTVNLSDSVYGSTSVAAVAVAAHECGHVMQHETGYVPGSNAGIWIVMLGFLMGLSDKIVTLGILLFSLGVLFQVVTLPVEFNASRRALSMLDSYGILSSDEVGKSREVLTAAALTYVASAASSVLSLLRLIFLNNRRRSD